MTNSCRHCCVLPTFLILAVYSVAPPVGAVELKDRLAATNYKLVYETYDQDNWDLAIVNADGTGRTNVTNSTGVHELYPQASPDGKKICFVVDSGKGRNTLRSVWVMNVDGLPG